MTGARVSKQSFFEHGVGLALRELYGFVVR